MFLMGSLGQYSANRSSFALVSAVGLGVSSAVNLAGLLLWVRLLTPAEFGTLALVTGAALMVNALGFEWLRLAGARTLPDPQAAEGISANRLAAWLRVAALAAAGVTLATLVATLAGISPPGLSLSWNGAILLLALSEMPFAAATLVVRLRLSATRFAAAMIARSTLALGGGVLLIVTGGGPAGIVIATAFAQLIVTALIIIPDPLWRRSIARPVRPADSAVLVCLGAPLIASSALMLAAASLDRYLVAGALGLDAAGRFAAPAELVAKTMGFALMAINLGAYPYLVRTYDRDGPAAAARALRRNLAHLLLAALPFLLGFILLARPLAAALLDRSSLPLAAELLPWLAAAALMRLLVGFHFAVALQLARRMAWLSLPPLVTLALLVPFARPAIDARGLVGFAQLLFVSHAAGAVTAWWLARRALPNIPPGP